MVAPERSLADFSVTKWAHGGLFHEPPHPELKRIPSCERTHVGVLCASGSLPFAERCGPKQQRPPHHRTPLLECVASLLTMRGGEVCRGLGEVSSSVLYGMRLAPYAHCTPESAFRAPPRRWRMNAFF